MKRELRRITANKKDKKEEGEQEDIGIKEVFKALSLFFALTVISALMLSPKFEQGVNDFWEKRESLQETAQELDLDWLFEA